MLTKTVSEKDRAIGPGDRIGDYEVIAKIGQGGIAEIFRGRQMSLDRDVAIKLLLPSMNLDSDIVSRFEQEACIIGKLRHPNVVHVIDRGTDRGRYYFVMEYVEGTNFKEILQKGNYSLEQQIDVVIQLLKALDYAHKNGIVHRDVKPSNILIDTHGHVMVADFGIAQIADKDAAERTGSGIVMGTFAYMSPEQRTSSTNVDQRTDIYSVGVILYEIATGRKPLGKFKTPSESNLRLPPKFDEIVMKCLEQDPVDRYSKAVEVKDALLSALRDSSKSSKEPSSITGSIKGFIGNCSFLDTIKESRFGATYLVENRSDGQLYIIKKMLRREMGLKEAKILSRLEHPNIIKIHGAGGDVNKAVIVTEYAQGGSLADRLAAPLPMPEALRIFRQIADALSFAHRNNIVHGNVRPSNVLFDSENRVKLTDFALPEHYDKDNRNWYGAPERRKDKASDIYSCGAILHHMLTGKLPIFDNYGRLLMQGAELRLPFALTEMIGKMLKKNISERYAQLDTVLADLDQYEKDLKEESFSSTTPEETRLLMTTKMKRVRRIVLIVLVGLLSALATLYLDHAGILDRLFSLDL